MLEGISLEFTGFNNQVKNNNFTLFLFQLAILITHLNLYPFNLDGFFISF